MAVVNLTSNGATYDTSGQKFGSGAINGGYLQNAGVLPTSGAWTIEGWVKTTGTALAVAMGQKSYAFIGMDGNGNAFAHYGNSTDVALNSSTKINDGAYHHVALSYDTSAGGKLFVDGTLVASSATTTDLATGNSFAIGNFGSATTYPWSGDVDEVAVWSTAKYTAAFTPPTSAYAGSETGLIHLYHLDGNGTDSYGTAASSATAYTLAGSSSGAVGRASSAFTVTASGTTSAAITVTPSDGGAGGAFSPASVSLAAGTNSAGSFTYTPASAGAKTISTTNNGGLTNPSSLTYTAISPVPVTSGAFHFSPANWRGDTGRGGSSYRQTFYCGAYLDFVFTAGSSPTATLLLGSNANSLPVSYFVNGALQDNVATASLSSLALQGLVPNAVNTVRLYVRSSPSTSRWSGTNTLQVQGMLLDGGSTPGTAASPVPWVLFGGDSINEGWVVDGGNSNFLHSASFQVVETLRAKGYDVGMMAATGSGFLGVGNGNVPGLYSVSNGTYSDGASRWNKVDSGVSLLDSAGQISAYGATGTAPAAILWNFGTNDANQAVSQSDLRLSVKGVFGAIAAAAPGAKIVMVPGFPLEVGNVGSAATSAAYLSTIAAGFADAKAANPTAFLTYADLGVSFAQQIYGTPANIQDIFHPSPLGNAYIAPRILDLFETALSPTGASIIPFRRGFRG